MADIADINEDIFQNDYAESPSYLSQQIITYIGIEPPLPQGERIPTNYRLTSSVYLVG